MEFHLSDQFETRPPATPQIVSQLCGECGFDLPRDYIEFLCFANGGVGFLWRDLYADLWRAEDSIQLNRGYQVHDFAPDVFLFGSNGGGEGFGFDFQQESLRVVQLPLIGMASDGIRTISESFTDFVQGRLLGARR